MTMPHPIWRLSIVLAFFLHHSSSSPLPSPSTTTTTTTTNVSTDDPYKEYMENEQNYEVIEVADQQGSDNKKIQTGKTTRIFTTGEVDDDFWLKHLGEDFKHAIHLQVGGTDQNDGIYNMTEDGSKYDIHHEYEPKENPVEENGNYPTEKAFITEGTNNTSKLDENENSEKNVKGNESKHESSGEDQPPYERLFTLDDGNGMNFAEKFYNPKSFDIPNEDPSNQKYTQYPKVHRINVKYNPPSHTRHNTSDKHNMAKMYSPIVVTLPESHNKVHQLADKEVPVVVKMPPVIYHRSPTYTHDNTETKTHSHAHSKKTHDTEQHYSNHQRQTPYSQYSHNVYNPPSLGGASDDPTNNLRYIVRKPAPVQQSQQINGYSRQGRSSQDLFYQGL